MYTVEREQSVPGVVALLARSRLAEHVGKFLAVLPAKLLVRALPEASLLVQLLSNARVANTVRVPIIPYTTIERFDVGLIARGGRFEERDHFAWRVGSPRWGGEHGHVVGLRLRLSSLQASIPVYSVHLANTKLAGVKREW